MSLAFTLARDSGRYDAYLLFNDDVVVDPKALGPIIEEYRQLNAQGPAILAAATKSRVDGSITYSAMRRTSKLRPLSICKMIPSGTPQACDTFNGNFVLVPAPFFEAVGGLDRRYVQSYADMDLGYVAEALGVPRYLASIPIGLCEGHPAQERPESPLASALRKLGTQWGKRDSIGQRAHFILKHVPLPVSLPIAAASAFRMMVGRAAARLGPRS
jgi:GT2 family glycosyltransferase